MDDDDKLIEACKATSSFQRKKAFEKLELHLNKNNNNSSSNNNNVSTNDTIVTLKRDKLIHLTIQTLDDQIERCRTISLNILIKHYNSLFTNGNENEKEANISLLINKLESRMINEETEELRMEMMKLVNQIIITRQSIDDTSLIFKYCEKIMTMIKIGLGDRNYEQVDLCNGYIINLCKVIPTRVNLFSSMVTPLLIRNLGDRHQKVRSSSINALTALIECGDSKCVETIISPNTNNQNSSNLLPLLSNDHAPNVRLTLANNLASWSIHSSKLNTSVIIYTLLSLLTSDIPQVIEASLKSLNTISNHYYELKEQQTGQTRMEKVNYTSDILYRMPQHQVLDWKYCNDSMAIESSATRDYISRCSKKVFQHLYKTYHDNELDPVHRETKVGVIYLLIVYLGFNATSFTDAIMEMLMAAENDMMPSIRSKVMETSQLVGYFCSPDSWIKKQTNTIKNLLQQDITNSTSKSLLLSSFNLLNGLLKGLSIKGQQLKQQEHGITINGNISAFHLNEIQVTALLSTFCQVVYNQCWYLQQSLEKALIQLIEITKDIFTINSQTTITGEDNNSKLKCDLIYLLILLTQNPTQQEEEGGEKGLMPTIFESILTTSWKEYLNNYGRLVIMNILNRDIALLYRHSSYLKVAQYICQNVSNPELLQNSNNEQDKLKLVTLKQQFIQYNNNNIDSGIVKDKYLEIFKFLGLFHNDV